MNENLKMIQDISFGIDMNLMAFMLLLYIFVRNLKKNNLSTNSAKYLSITTISVLTTQVLEVVNYILKILKIPELFCFVEFLVNLEYLLPVFSFYCFSHFIYSYVNADKKMDSTFNLYYKIPLIVNTLTIITNPFTNIFFTLSKDFVYHRGPWLYSTMLIIIFYIGTTAYFIFKSKLYITKKEYFIFNIFFLLMAIGRVIQNIFPEALVMWNIIAFSLMIVYFYSDGKPSKNDSLTGALTRANFEKYMDTASNNTKFGLAFFDLDNFKEINTKFGHATGDTALKLFASIIPKFLKNNEIFVRYGGDEFVVCFEDKELHEISNVIHEIDVEINKINSSIKKFYF